MKLRMGDQVIVTAGKDRGKKSQVVKVMPQTNRVVVKGVNLYTRNIKKTSDRAGEQVRRERSLPTANVAILNDKGQVDRVGYRVAKDGSKERIYKKTGKTIPEPKIDTKKK